MAVSLQQVRTMQPSSGPPAASFTTSNMAATDVFQTDACLTPRIRCQTTADITDNGTGHTISRYVDPLVQAHFAAVSNFIKCDFYLLIFELLEEDLRGAMQNLNPAIDNVHLYIIILCLYSTQLSQIQTVSLQS